MDDQAKAFLTAVAAAGRPSVTEITPAEAREMYAGLSGVFLPERDDIIVEDMDAGGVPARLYRPENLREAILPVALYFHGGGWLMGSLKTHDTLCQHLCHHSGAAILSVDYRLAPEAPFPAAVDDCHRALQFVFHHSRTLKINPARIAVAGDSAGGNLAALVSKRITDERRRASDAPSVSFQCLIYPVTDAGCNTPSYKEFATEHGLSKEEMRYFWSCYCGGSQKDERSASPLQMSDCTDLPPAWILTAEFDVLRDEGERFADKMKAAGVSVELERWSGQIHGFFHLAGFFNEGKRAVERAAQKLKEALQ